MLFPATKHFAIGDRCLSWLSLRALLLWKLLINASVFSSLETFTLGCLGEFIEKSLYFWALWKFIFNYTDYMGKRNKGFQEKVLNGHNFFAAYSLEICFTHWSKDMPNINIASF